MVIRNIQVCDGGLLMKMSLEISNITKLFVLQCMKQKESYIHK